MTACRRTPPSGERLLSGRDVPQGPGSGPARLRPALGASAPLAGHSAIERARGTGTCRGRGGSASRIDKSILTIPAKTMETLVQWAWPGNIRELENFVERSVILTPGPVLQVPLSELHAEPEPEESVTLHDKERERILRALRECKGQLGGPNGAAARLGLKRTTLQSKLTQLGINPGGYRA